MRNLYLYGLRDNKMVWITRYLAGRLQFNNIGDSCSTVPRIERGIPQGRFLGPLLFLIFLNDLCKWSQTLKLCIYADDTSLLDSQKKNMYELIDRQSIGLIKISHWFVANQLSFNESKTKFMVYHRSNKLNLTVPAPIRIGNASINRVYSFTFLEIVLDVNMKFK